MTTFKMIRFQYDHPQSGKMTITHKPLDIYNYGTPKLGRNAYAREVELTKLDAEGRVCVVVVDNNFGTYQFMVYIDPEDLTEFVFSMWEHEYICYIEGYFLVDIWNLER